MMKPRMAKKANASPAPASSRARRVILYCGGDPAQSAHSFFFLSLVWKLMMEGKRRGLEIVPVMDSRPPNRLDSMPQEVSALLEKRGIDGIIGVMLYETMVEWIASTGLPYSALFGGNPPNHLSFDDPQMIDLAFARLSELGCKSAGLMVPMQVATADVLEHVEEAARRFGMEVNYESILVSRNSRELGGYSDFLSLWGMPKRPEGLIVFPDVTARGVLTAILERGVKVPEELKLILHRNAEAPYSAPVPCDWVENSGGAMAEALVDQLEAQWEGREPKKIRVPFRLVAGE